METLLEYLSRPKQARFHRSRWKLERRGDFVVGEPLDIAQHEDLAKRQRQRIDCANDLAVDRVVQRKRGDLFLQLGRIRLDQLAPALIAPVRVDEMMSQDGDEPALDIGAALVRVPGLI